MSEETHEVEGWWGEAAAVGCARRGDGGGGVPVVTVQKDGFRERSATGRVRPAVGEGARAWKLRGVKVVGGGGDGGGDGVDDRDGEY